jgi:hypothetical protein
MNKADANAPLGGCFGSSKKPSAGFRQTFAGGNVKRFNCKRLASSRHTHA